MKCWGLATEGQLGDGTMDHPPFAAVLQPVEVVGIDDATRLVTGAWHSCALLASGKMVCWGRGELGQLGDGDQQHRYAPVPVHWHP